MAITGLHSIVSLLKGIDPRTGAFVNSISPVLIFYPILLESGRSELVYLYINNDK